MQEKIPFPLDRDLLDKVLAWIDKRIVEGSNSKSGAVSFEILEKTLGGSISSAGLGGTEAFELFAETIIPSSRPFDHPTSLSFVAAAPTPASLIFDAALGPAEIFAGNWDGGSGAIHAENQALAWLSKLAGFPDNSGGVFVAGGTMGNLSALHAARTYRESKLGKRPKRWKLVTSREAHSSILSAARVMDVDLLLAESDEYGRTSIDAVQAVINNPEEVFAVVVNAGSTNCGAIDDIEGIANYTSSAGIWLHVDGAYGLAALASPNQRPLFNGIEKANSFIVDPHKWLFSPYDCCALVYKEPTYAAQAHGQKAEYLETLDKDAWNPSDFAIHLTRRARGLPLWFSLATYGTDAYAKAIDQVIKKTEIIAQAIKDTPQLELLFDRQLSVILFRCSGMSENDMKYWAETHRRSGALLCLPTFWRGESVFRICLVNPATDTTHVINVLKTLAA